MEVAPTLSAVIAEGHPAVSFPSMRTGIEVDRAITEFDKAGFPGAIEGKGRALMPGFSMVIAVDCIGVTLALLLLTVVGHDPGGNEEPALVRALPEGDPGIAGAVRNGKETAGILFEGNILQSPGLAVVLALVHRQGGVESGQEDHHFPGCFVDDRGSEAGYAMVFIVAPTLSVVRADPEFLVIEFDGLTDELMIAPGSATVLGAFQIDLAAPALVGVWFALKTEEEDCSVHGDIEHPVDVVLVPDFKERFSSSGNAGDFSGGGRRTGICLLGHADWSGSKEEKTKRGGARNLHESEVMFRRPASSGQGRVHPDRPGQ